MLDGVLLGPEGEKWKQEPRKMPEAYEAWVDAQIFSKEAAGLWEVYSDLIYPLEKTKRKAVLDQFWQYVRKVGPPLFPSSCRLSAPLTAS